MNGIAQFYEGIDPARLMFGCNAFTVPARFVVQDAGFHEKSGIQFTVVSFIGMSVLPNSVEHPLKFGSPKVHQFVNAELVVRPNEVRGSDICRGFGLGGIIKSEEFCKPELWEDVIIKDGARR